MVREGKEREPGFFILILFLFIYFFIYLFLFIRQEGGTQRWRIDRGKQEGFMFISAMDHYIFIHFSLQIKRKLIKKGK